MSFRYFLLAIVVISLSGCAGSPFETNDISKNGNIYRETEVNEYGEPRTTVKVKAAQF